MNSVDKANLSFAIYKMIRDTVPILTVDGVLLSDNKLLLIKRNTEPFKDSWALPGNG